MAESTKMCGALSIWLLVVLLANWANGIGKEYAWYLMGGTAVVKLEKLLLYNAYLNTTNLWKFELITAEWIVVI